MGAVADGAEEDVGAGVHKAADQGDGAGGDGRDLQHVGEIEQQVHVQHGVLHLVAHHAQSIAHVLYFSHGGARMTQCGVGVGCCHNGSSSQ